MAIGKDKDTVPAITIARALRGKRESKHIILSDEPRVVVCAHVCMCVRALCVRVCMRVSVCVRARVSMSVCMCECACLRSCMYKYVCVFVYVCKCVSASVRFLEMVAIVNRMTRTFISI